MKEFTVSLRMLTKEVSLTEARALTGLEFGSSSHTKGELRGNKEPFGTTVAVFEEVTGDGTLNPLIQQLLDGVKRTPLHEIRKAIADVAFVLDICALFDTVDCSLDISAGNVKLLGERNIGINISYYPTCFDAT